MKLQNPNGGNLRDSYTFFEVNALKYANEKLENGELSLYDTFVFGGSGTQFVVNEFTPELISITRRDTQKLLVANRVDKLSRKDNNGATAQNKAVNGLKSCGVDVDNVAPVEQKAVKTPENGQNAVSNTADVAAKIAEALSGLQINNGATSTVDVETVRRIVREEIANNKPTATVTVTVNNAPSVEVDGLLHAKFNEALFWAANRQPVYLYGPAGTGKNVLAEQVAKALNLPFYYAGSLQFKTDLEGFVNAAGEYVETDFYKAFTGGGVFLLDELDATAAEVLVAFGACLANRYYNFPKHGKLEAHPDFIVFASGNTAGRGANETYNGRYQLDASTLDRFAFIPMDYDKRIELACANGNEDLVNFAHELREVVSRCNLTYTVSPRALKRIALGLQCPDIDKKQLFNSALCAGWAKGDIQMIALNLNDDSNQFVETFKKIAE